MSSPSPVSGSSGSVNPSSAPPDFLDVINAVGSTDSDSDVDSMDPTDPNSVAYDPAVAAGRKSGADAPDKLTSPAVVLRIQSKRTKV